MSYYIICKIFGMIAMVKSWHDHHPGITMIIQAAYVNDAHSPYSLKPTLLPHLASLTVKQPLEGTTLSATSNCIFSDTLPLESRKICSCCVTSGMLALFVLKVKNGKLCMLRNLGQLAFEYFRVENFKQ